MTKRLYIYAITDAHIRVDDVPGVAREPLQVLTAAAAAPPPSSPPTPSLTPAPPCYIIVGELRERPTATRESLAAQDAVVRTLAARVEALLPMRFGTTFDDETALHEALNRLDATRLHAALSRVRGCEQMTLRFFRLSEAPESAIRNGASDPDAAPLTTAPASPRAAGPAAPRDAAPAAESPRGAGTAYLQARAAAIAHATQSPRLLSLPIPQLQALRERLSDIVRDEIVEAAPATRAPLVASLYHLVAHGHDARYRAIVAAWPAPGDLMTRVSGPAPVYAFAKDALS